MDEYTQKRRDYSWVLDGTLAVGAAPTRYEVLERLGFSAALSLQESREGGPEHNEIPRDFTRVQVPIRDGVVGGVPTVDQVETAVTALRDLLADHVVYVHCYAGVGRSPLVCIAYLARFHAMSASEAIRFVQRQHPNADPTNGQLSTLKQFLDRAKA